jgi:hypothetical protein
MMAADSLVQIQRWMQAVIQQPDGEGAARIDDVLRPSRALSSRDRLQIYSQAYVARLLEVLRGEFPATAATVGDELFAGFALGYLQEYPSTSYTLAELGAKLPQHLAKTRPPRETDAPDWVDCLIDLATLERLYSEVFDGPGTEDSPPFALGDIDPDRWPDCRLVFAPCVRLVRLRFPVHEVITAARKGEQPPLPAAMPTQLVVTRRDYIVRRQGVSDQEFRLLSSLHAGATVGDALSQWFAETPDESPPIQEWFERWTAAGYFTSITDAPESSVPVPPARV